MNHRIFLSAVAGAWMALAPVVGAAEDRPNIIYILLDDAGYGDFGCYGQTKIDTPVIDGLARDGMKFTQHYSGSTVCAPSRCALMTGLHTGHSYIRGNKELLPEGQEPMPAATLTLPKVLKQAGYATGLVGKWGLGAPGTEGEPNKQGFDYFYGFNCQRQAHKHYPPTLNENGKTIPVPNNVFGARLTYAQDLFRGKAIQFIETNQDQPFFLYLALNTPHAELLAPRGKLWDKYAAKGWPETPYVETKAGRGKDKVGGYASQDFPNVAYATMVNRIDQDIGKILQQLESLGLAENTLVLFSSDNGPHFEGGCQPEFFNSNGPFNGLKRDLLEGGVRVPFIVRWPAKVAAGTTSDHISAFWDVLPTFAELAGVPVPSEMDGISFAPTLTGKGEQGEHDYLYWEFHHGKGYVNQAIRRGDWKAIRRKVVKGVDSPILLFDLSKDIEEENDVAAQNPEVVASLKKIFAEARTDSELFPLK